MAIDLIVGGRDKINVDSTIVVKMHPMCPKLKNVFMGMHVDGKHKEGVHTIMSTLVSKV
jgi:hypothetical protein